MTTKHHDGFCLFDSKLTDFTSVKRAPARRDFIREYADACRSAGLGVGFYYSLMDWHHPDWYALKRGDRAGHKRFLDYIHGQIHELMTHYGKIDLLFYDVAAPYELPGEWKAREMNAMVRRLQPGILVNDRNRLPGDYSTPEQEITAPPPGRAWESVMTLNGNWGYSRGDDQWKTPKTVVTLLQRVACTGGSLMINVGPRPDGSVPSEYGRILGRVGNWLARCGESVLSPQQKAMVMCAVGGHTVANGCAYVHAQSYAWPEIGLGGIRSKVKRVTVLGTGKPVKFEQAGTRIRLLDLPAKAPDPVVTVFRIEAEGGIELRKHSVPDYLTGMRHL